MALDRFGHLFGPAAGAGADTRYVRRPVPVAGVSRLTAALPVENPYCSCKLRCQWEGAPSCGTKEMACRWVRHRGLHHLVGSMGRAPSRRSTALATTSRSRTKTGWSDPFAASTAILLTPPLSIPVQIPAEWKGGCSGMTVTLLAAALRWSALATT